MPFCTMQRRINRLTTSRSTPNGKLRCCAHLLRQCLPQQRRCVIYVYEAANAKKS